MIRLREVVKGIKAMTPDRQLICVIDNHKGLMEMVEEGVIDTFNTYKVMKYDSYIVTEVKYSASQWMIVIRKDVRNELF